MDTPAATPEKIRVLVVEDDPPTGHALELLLKHYRYEVITAKTVAAALLGLGSNPNVVLLDLMLPDGDGLTVLEAIRDRHLQTHVTVLTGVGDPDRLDRARQLKPDAMLQKPVDFLQILQQLPPAA